jgi:hypothetical protein
MQTHPLKAAYNNQKGCAKERGIAFDLTFGQWLGIWIESGRLAQRGRKRGCYVMARFGDVGPYEPGNVKIILVGENIREHMCGTSKLRGRKLSVAHRRNVIRALERRGPCSEQTKAKISAKARARAEQRATQ